MTQQQEKFTFQTEAAQILQLMTHSVYSNRDTFLRELISNASDATDRRKFMALSNHDLLDPNDDYSIFLKSDPQARTLTIIDKGIGMSRDEVIANIGTIARSGTKEFAKALKEAQEHREHAPDLIGQFGIGFYSVFMVADQVILDTLKAGEETATRWESKGDGTYTLSVGERREIGTTITLHLKPHDDEAGLRDFTSEWVLRDVVKRYSDFVSYPIKTNVTRQEPERDSEGKPVEGGKTTSVVSTETLNSMKAIWTRPQNEVSDEEFNEFYHHISHDWQEPLKRVHVKAEGASEYRALLFIPKKAPFDLFYQSGQKGLRLYVRRVLIMDECKELLPEYLRFVRGVVDAEDLPLNVSREILQEDRQIKVIRKHLVKKVIETLTAMKGSERESYESLFGEIGRALKEGIYQDDAHKEALLDLVLCQSTYEPGKLTSLREYEARLKEGQDAIYYMTGPSISAVRTSPHLEAFVAKGYEVLLFDEAVDEIWLQQGAEFGGRKLKSIGKGEVELGSEEERKKAEEALEEKKSTYKSLLTRLRAELQDDIKEVRLSNRMTASAACLVGEASDLSPQLADMLKQMGQSLPKQQRILEVNPKHEVLEGLQRVFDKNPQDAVITDYAKLLYGQALLAEGGSLPQPGEFSKLVASVMARALPQ